MSDNKYKPARDKSHKRRILASPGDPSPPSPTQRLHVPTKKPKHTYEDEITFSDEITYRPSTPAQALSDDEVPTTVLLPETRHGSRVTPSARSAYMMENDNRSHANRDRRSTVNQNRDAVDDAAIPRNIDGIKTESMRAKPTRIALDQGMGRPEEDDPEHRMHPHRARTSSNPFDVEQTYSDGDNPALQPPENRGVAVFIERSDRHSHRYVDPSTLDRHGRRVQDGYKTSVPAYKEARMNDRIEHQDGRDDPIPRSYVAKKFFANSSTLKVAHKSGQGALSPGDFSINRGRRSVSPDTHFRGRSPRRRSPSWASIQAEDSDIFGMDEDIYESSGFADVKEKADDAIDKAVKKSVAEAVVAAEKDANLANKGKSKDGNGSGTGVGHKAARKVDSPIPGAQEPETQPQGIHEEPALCLDDYVDENLPPLSYCEVRQQFPHQSTTSSSSDIEFMDLALMSPDFKPDELLMVESAHNFEFSVPYANIAICKPYAFDLEQGTNRLIWNSQFVSRSDSTMRTDKARNVVGIMIGQVRHPNLKKAVSLSYKTFYLSRRLGIRPTEMALNRTARLMATKLQWPAVKLSYDKGSIMNFSTKGSSNLNTTTSPTSSRYTRPARGTADGGNATIASGYYPNVLDFTADVRVYDARGTDFRFTKERLDKLHELPEYTSFTEDKDLNCRCVVAVGYTMNAWGIPAERPTGYAHECPSISTNIQFAIVLAVLPFE